VGQERPNLAADALAVEAEAPAGRFRGLQRDGVATFRGIRYAQPPVGPLRFAPPLPAMRPVGLCDALAAGPISIQDIDPLPLVIPGAENNYYGPNAVASEDCLNLNVWSADLAGRAPVLVWIHGGAFLCGSGSGPWLDGSRHARDNGLVVVTLNYRLGYLGGLFLGDYDSAVQTLRLRQSSEATACGP
jgi:para-nitrobenzyl esterase